MRHGCIITVLLLVVGLVCPYPASFASSEGDHGGDAKKGEGKEAGKIENGVLNYGPVVVNVLSNKGYHILRLGMQIQCDDNASAERLTKPDAKEALMLLLSTRMAEELLPSTGKMILRKDLMECMSGFAGQGKVKGLYFTDFVLQ
jgi:flagellar FliL protein